MRGTAKESLELKLSYLLPPPIPVAILENKIGEFSLGPIKTFRGHDGETCMQGTILRNGKKVGEWSEDAWGGPHRIDFKNAADDKAFKATANAHPTAVEFAAEMLAKHGKQDTNDHADLVLSSIAQDIEQQAQFKRWCKTKIVIKDPRGKGGRDEWTNVVTACHVCNQRKACRSPREAKMDLLYVPYAPCRFEHFILSGRNILADQMDYLAARLPDHSRLAV